MPRFFKTPFGLDRNRGAGQFTNHPDRQFRGIVGPDGTGDGGKHEHIGFGLLEGLGIGMVGQDRALALRQHPDDGTGQEGVESFAGVFVGDNGRQFLARETVWARDGPPAVADGDDGGASQHHEIGHVFAGIAQTLDGDRQPLQRMRLAGHAFEQDLDRHHSPLCHGFRPQFRAADSTGFRVTTPSFGVAHS